MSFELPPLPKIDRSRAGFLSISVDVLHVLLGLPPTVRLSSENGVVTVLIEGTDMPVCRPGARPDRVSLSVRIEEDFAGARTAFAHWEHKPEIEWRIAAFDPVKTP